MARPPRLSLRDGLASLSATFPIMSAAFFEHPMSLPAWRDDTPCPMSSTCWS